MKSADLFDVRGQAAFVTGAASGIGLAIAQVMADNGAHVTLADVDAAGLKRAAAALGERGGAVATALVDIADRERLHAAVEDARDRYGKLDTVFANAGISAGPSFAAPEGRLEAVSPADWERALQVNLTGAFETLRAAAVPMTRQGFGQIVVTASISGMRASPVSGYAYVAAKAALINLVRQAAVELGPRNVRVNAIAPGYIATNLAGGRLKRDPELARELQERVPLGRIGQPEDLKGVALFLASPASSYVTGAVIPVDGGVTAA